LVGRRHSRGCESGIARRVDALKILFDTQHPVRSHLPIVADLDPANVPTVAYANCAGNASQAQNGSKSAVAGIRDVTVLGSKPTGSGADIKTGPAETVGAATGGGGALCGSARSVARAGRENATNPKPVRMSFFIRVLSGS
jgi:hypothetical protein